MTVKRRSLIRILALSLVFLSVMIAPQSDSRIDSSPKPSMEFEFIEGDSMLLTDDVVEAFLVQCDLSDCSDAKLVESIGVKGFSCTENICSSTAYGYREYQRLTVTLSTGEVYQSNVFGKQNFNAKYRASLVGTRIEVHEKRGVDPLWVMVYMQVGGFVFVVMTIVGVIPIVMVGKSEFPFREKPKTFIITWVLALYLVITGGIISNVSFLLVILIEVGLILIYARLRHCSLPYMATIVVWINLLTLPALSIVHNVAAADSCTGLLAVIWVVEAALLFRTQRNMNSIYEALGVSLVLNLASVQGEQVLTSFLSHFLVDWLLAI